MSTITVMFEMPGVTAAQYDQVIQGLEAAGEGNPKGRLYHVAVPKEEGWLVVDVWESGGQRDPFAQTHNPNKQKNRVSPPQPPGYPVDNKGKKVDLTMAYVGTRAIFERAGFTKVADTQSVSGGFPRVLMRLELQ